MSYWAQGRAWGHTGDPNARSSWDRHMLGWRSCYQLLELTGARQDQSKFYYLKGKKKDTWDLHERTALFQALIREADI